MKIMQNKILKSTLEQRKIQRVPKVIKPVIKSRILFTHHSRYNENTKVSSSHNLVVPFVEGYEGKTTPDMLTDEKLTGLHRLMIQTFDSFLLQLDEIFTNLRTEERFKSLFALPTINHYKDICEKLRHEVLIAIDKLELTNIKGNIKEKDAEFLDKMNGLKSQLFKIRRQYHQAVQEWNLVNK